MEQVRAIYAAHNDHAAVWDWLWTSPAERAVGELVARTRWIVGDRARFNPSDDRVGQLVARAGDDPPTPDPIPRPHLVVKCLDEPCRALWYALHRHPRHLFPMHEVVAECAHWQLEMLRDRLEDAKELYQGFEPEPESGLERLLTIQRYLEVAIFHHPDTQMGQHRSKLAAREGHESDGNNSDGFFEVGDQPDQGLDSDGFFDDQHASTPPGWQRADAQWQQAVRQTQRQAARQARRRQHQQRRPRRHAQQQHVRGSARARGVNQYDALMLHRGRQLKPGTPQYHDRQLDRQHRRLAHQHNMTVDNLRRIIPRRPQPKQDVGLLGLLGLVPRGRTSKGGIIGGAVGLLQS